MKGPVGWFPDPDGGNGLRYFDGQQWTQIAPPPAAAAPAQPVSVVVNNTNTVGAPQQAHPVAFLVIMLIVFSPFLIGLAITLFVIEPMVLWLLVAVAVVCGIAYGMTKSEERAEKRQAAARREKEKLSVRAEVEDELYQQGDPRGTYGRYPPPPEEDLK